MSDNPHTLPSQPSTGPVLRKPYVKNEIPDRDSFTPKNALQFQGVFDKMIETQLNQEVLTALTGFKPSSLYIKANDALKWLSECHTTNADKYSLLRNRVSITRLEDKGILIYFKKSVVNLINQGTVSVSADRGWKEQLVDWLKTAQDGDLWERKEISIGEDDKKWIAALLCDVAGAEVEIGLNMVRVMR